MENQNRRLARRFFAQMAIWTVVAMVVSPGSLATDYDITGTVTDSSGTPVDNQAVLVKNCGTGQSTTVYTDQYGNYQADSSSIGLSSGGCLSVSASTTQWCQGLPIELAAVGMVMSVQLTPPITINLKMQQLQGGPNWGVKLDLGQVDSDWSNANGVVASNGLGFGRAQAASGLFDAEVDFLFVDTENDGQLPVMNRWYDFELAVTYTGYISSNCGFVAAQNPTLIHSALDGEVSYTEFTGVNSGVQTMTFADLSSAQGQPGSALFIVVQIDAHIINLEAVQFRANAVITVADFPATGTYWVVP